MRRLQANLAYLAAIADRSHKPSSQIPSHPAYMNAPSIAPRANIPSTAALSPATDEENKEHIKGLYSQLQALFPGVDPNFESHPTPTARPGAKAPPPGTKPTVDGEAEWNKGQKEGDAAGTE